jgi:hypothetical protein
MEKRWKLRSLPRPTDATAARQRPTLNGLPILVDVETGWKFIPLPRHFWKSTHEPCNCPHCKGGVGYMDTLVIPDCGTTLFIHFPEVHAKQEPDSNV